MAMTTARGTEHRSDHKKGRCFEGPLQQSLKLKSRMLCRNTRDFSPLQNSPCSRILRSSTSPRREASASSRSWSPLIPV